MRINDSCPGHFAHLLITRLIPTTIMIKVLCSLFFYVYKMKIHLFNTAVNGLYHVRIFTNLQFPYENYDTSFSLKLPYN